MASKRECDEYAKEMARKFEDFIQWSLSNWPDKNFPLLASDFAASRREIAGILGDKLCDDGSGTAKSDSSYAQYVDITPAPWP